jgi:hypothetical protein
VRSSAGSSLLIDVVHRIGPVHASPSVGIDRNRGWPRSSEAFLMSQHDRAGDA